MQSILVIVPTILMLSVLIYFLVAMLMGRELAAKREIYIQLDSARIPRKRIRETLESLGCRIVRDQKTDIEGRIGFNVCSWGECISVVFVDKGMKIQSQCVWQYQAFDWGKNWRNLKRFKAEWEKRNATVD